MAIEIVTEKQNTHPKDVLESNAVVLIIKALEDYFPEAAEHALAINILTTLKQKPAKRFHGRGGVMMISSAEELCECWSKKALAAMVCMLEQECNRMREQLTEAREQVAALEQRCLDLCSEIFSERAETEAAQRQVKLKAQQLTEALRLLQKIAVDKEWADAHEWQDAVNTLLEKGGRHDL